MTAPLAPRQLRNHHGILTYSKKDEPNDSRRPPGRLLVRCRVEDVGTFSFTVIGVMNYQKKKIQVDLVQAMDPGFPMYTKWEFVKFRDAIYEGLDEQGYEAWGLQRYMVDLMP